MCATASATAYNDILRDATKWLDGGGGPSDETVFACVASEYLMVEMRQAKKIC